MSDAADPMFAVIGDIHSNEPRLATVIERLRSEAAHLSGVLLVGDLSSGLGRSTNPSAERRAAYFEDLRRILATIRSLGRPVAWVPGNHDLPSFPAEFVGNIDDRCIEIDGVRIAGIGGAGPQRFGFPYEWDEEAIDARAIPECDILLCHCPPFHTPLDLVWHGPNVGSRAIRSRAERHRGLLLCGHIHEAMGAIQLRDCLCVNVGSLGRPYEKTQVTFVRRTTADGRFHVRHEDLETGEILTWSQA